MARVPVLRPLTGEFTYVDEADFDTALAQGFTAPTPQEIAQEELGQKYGGLEAKAGAAVTGALRGATFGLSDVALSALGAEEAIKAYEQLEPGIALGAELAGTVAPVLLTAGAAAPEAGAGLAARIAARTPAALAARAGEAAVSRLGLAATEGATQTIGRTAARYATQAGVESALQGIGRETGRLALDNELSGEKIGQIAAAGLTSGLTGFGIGAGLGVLGGAATKAYTSIPKSLQGTEFEPRISATLLKLRARMAGKTGADLEAVAQLAQPEMRAIALDADATIARVIEGEQAAGPLERRIAQAGSLQDDLDKKFIGQQITSQAIRDGHLKIELVRGNVADDAERLLAQRDFATTEIFQALDEVKQARAAGSLEYGQTGLKELEYELTKAAKSAEEALAVGGKQGAEDLYGALDVQAKRAIGRATARFEKLKAPTAADNRLMVEVLEPMYARVRKGLENEPIWGGVANLQREMNAPMTNAINANPALMSEWYQSTPFGVDPTNPWRTGRVANAQKIVTNLQAATNPGTNFADKVLREQISNEITWQDAALRLGNFENMGPLKEEFAAQTVRNKRIIEHLDKGTKAVLAKRLLDDIGGSSDSLIALAAGAAIAGGFITDDSSAPVAPLAVLMALLLKPRIMLRGAEMLDNIANSQTSRIGNAVARATKAVSNGAVTIAERAPVAGAAVVRYEDRAKRVKELSAQSDVVRQQLEQETSWMAEKAPKAQRSAINTALRQLDYLNNALPKGTAAPTPFAAPLPPTRQQVQSWLTKLRAVENPVSILDDIANGKLTVEAVDAVRTVYPETFRDIQAQMVDRLAKLQAKGKAPAYAQRIQLGLLLGIPSDPTMTPEVMQAVQGSYAAQLNAVREGAAGPAPQRGQKAPNIAEGFRSGSEETELTSGAQ